MKERKYLDLSRWLWVGIFIWLIISCRSLSTKQTEEDININESVHIPSQTALINAVKKLNLSVVKFLLQNGANPHYRDTQSLTAFDYAKQIEISSFCDTLDSPCHQEIEAVKQQLLQILK